MLILLPASDAKADVHGGRPVDLGGLSFPSLGPTRAAVLDALIEVSATSDGPRRLGVRPGLADAIRANVDVLDAPAGPAGAIYAGVLYRALGLGDLHDAAARRAEAWIIVVSALWGALRVSDRIPAYRLDMCGRLPGLGHLPDVWRGPLTDVLTERAASGVIVDGRSAGYATAWRPTGALAGRTAVLKVLRDCEGSRPVASHNAKVTRGLVAASDRDRRHRSPRCRRPRHGAVDTVRRRRAGGGGHQPGLGAARGRPDRVTRSAGGGVSERVLELVLVQRAGERGGLARR